MICKEIRKLENKKAEERMKAGTNQYSPPEKVPEGKKGDVRDLTAENVEWSGKTLERKKQMIG